MNAKIIQPRGRVRQITMNMTIFWFPIEPWLLRS
jgi:hypothetical protein